MFVNWLTFICLLAITIFIRVKSNAASLLVCPILNIFILYYMVYDNFPGKPKVKRTGAEPLTEEPLSAEMI